MPNTDTDVDAARSRSRRVSRWHSSAIPGVIMAPSAHRLAAVARIHLRESGEMEFSEIAISEGSGTVSVR